MELEHCGADNELKTQGFALLHVSRNWKPPSSRLERAFDGHHFLSLQLQNLILALSEIVCRWRSVLRKPLREPRVHINSLCEAATHMTILDWTTNVGPFSLQKKRTIGGVGDSSRLRLAGHLEADQSALSQGVEVEFLKVWHLVRDQFENGLESALKHSDVVQENRAKPFVGAKECDQGGLIAE